MDRTEKFWNKISGRYDKQVTGKYSKAYTRTIEKTRCYLKDTYSVLDFACGTGITTVELAKNVKEIRAIDISDNMIDLAKKKMEKHDIKNVNFTTCDIMSDTIKDQSFDVVLAFNILYFLEDIDEILIRIRHILKSGGLFISVTDCLGEKKSILNVFQSFLSTIGIIPYTRKYKMRELECLIEKAGFSIIETDNFYTNPPNYFVVAQVNLP
ncbi:MAG: class I SAM-dependent methyltransferase [Clostridiaceae bacterium]|nr:class I SAM-dependent methyltransferase [Clostridiaceae bacterium]